LPLPNWRNQYWRNPYGKTDMEKPMWENQTTIFITSRSEED
jgi:hypothetical protein